MTSFEQAPLTELGNFLSPENGKAFYFRTQDGVRLRLSIWNQSPSKGSVLLQSGRTEFIEKYFEVIKEFIDRGFCVAMFDWRGQGLSDRLIEDPYLGHVNSFSEYDLELHEVITKVYKTYCPKPWIGMGHSMGGCILATYASQQPQILNALILCAPMLSMRLSKFTQLFGLLIGFLSFFGLRRKTFARPEWNSIKGWHERPFKNNEVTSDRARYERSGNLIRKNEKLALGGLTIGWTYEALKRIKKIRDVKWAKKIECPTLLLNATHDRLVDADENKRICSLIPISMIENIEGHHELLMEKDDIRKQTWRAIDKFLLKYL